MSILYAEFNKIMMKNGKLDKFKGAKGIVFSEKVWTDGATEDEIFYELEIKPE